MTHITCKFCGHEYVKQVAVPVTFCPNCGRHVDENEPQKWTSETARKQKGGTFGT